MCWERVLSIYDGIAVPQEVPHPFSPGDAISIAVQLGQFVLLDHQGLLQLPLLNLQLLYLGFVPALILLALILAGLSKVLQSIACMLMLLLKRPDLPTTILEVCFQIAIGLEQASVLHLALLTDLPLMLECLLRNLQLLAVRPAHWASDWW